jgi:hypothetical protein
MTLATPPAMHRIVSGMNFSTAMHLLQESNYFLDFFFEHKKKAISYWESNFQRLRNITPGQLFLLTNDFLWKAISGTDLFSG